MKVRLEGRHSEVRTILNQLPLSECKYCGSLTDGSTRGKQQKELDLVPCSTSSTGRFGERTVSIFRLQTYCDVFGRMPSLLDNAI
jgi:hypothetical protein